jgi:hypothetical protein
MSQTDVAKALWGTLQSPNVPDRNLEPSNVVDAIDGIARGIFAVADALKEIAGKQKKRTTSEVLRAAVEDTPLSALDSSD